MSKVSVRTAAAMTGLSRETINKATQNGTLSFSRNSRNHKEIQISELERAFDIVKSIEEVERESDSVKPRQTASATDGAGEVASLEARLESSERAARTLIEERERERRQLEREIERLEANLEHTQDSFKRFQEQHSQTLLLLKDESQDREKRVGDWEASIAAMELRIANETKQQLKQIKTTHEKEVNKLKRALYAERKKSIWQKLFG